METVEQFITLICDKDGIVLYIHGGILSKEEEQMLFWKTGASAINLLTPKGFRVYEFILIGESLNIWLVRDVPPPSESTQGAELPQPASPPVPTAALPVSRGKLPTLTAEDIAPARKRFPEPVGEPKFYRHGNN